MTDLEIEEGETTPTVGVGVGADIGETVVELIIDHIIINLPNIHGKLALVLSICVHVYMLLIMNTAVSAFSSHQQCL